MAYNNIFKFVGLFLSWLISLKFMLVTVSGYFAYNSGTRKMINTFLFMLTWYVTGLFNTLYYITILGLYNMVQNWDEVVSTAKFLDSEIQSAKIDTPYGSEMVTYYKQLKFYCDELKGKLCDNMVVSRYQDAQKKLEDATTSPGVVSNVLKGVDNSLGTFYDSINSYVQPYLPSDPSNNSNSNTNTSSNSNSVKNIETKSTPDKPTTFEQFLNDNNLPTFPNPNSLNMADLPDFASLPDLSKNPVPTAEDLKNLGNMLKKMEDIQKTMDDLEKK